MKVLVTGGLGYIGSHTVVELQNEGFDVVVIDNLSNTTEEVLDGITEITGTKPQFEKLDLRHKLEVKNFFKRHQYFDGVIHFAASKAVGESVEKPIYYYENNVNALVYLLEEVKQLKQQNFIFSSSCTVYGDADTSPITETTAFKVAQSPYGNTKQIGENLLTDICAFHTRFNTISLRYFNPIGAHNSLHIGELPIGVPQNLVPYITQTAIGLRKQLSVFGNNYPTKDGTCVRDYIHVVDVAKAHVIALKRLLKKEQSSNYETFNLGTGKGTSVLEVIQSFERMSGEKLAYKITERRKGDIAMIYAETVKANTILGWKPNLTIDDAMLSAWQWEKKNKKLIYNSMKFLFNILVVLFTITLTAQSTYIHCGQLIDTKSGKLQPEMTVVVLDGKIISVENGYMITDNENDVIIDLSSKTVMPGLIDMHVHIESETNPKSYLEDYTLNDADVAFNSLKYAKVTLLNGFTTVRDLGGTGVNVALRNAINAGKVVGPRIFTAEKALATTGGHADPTNGAKKSIMGNPGPKEGVVNSIEDAKKAVRQRYKNGADLIKITATGGVLSVAKSGQNPQFSVEEIKAICETANDYGFHVAAHAHGDEGMRRAILGGVKTIEHGTLMSAETMELMKKHDVYLVPTISAGKFVSEKAKIPNYYPEVIVPKALDIGPKIQDMFSRAYKAGVGIAFGTDAAVFYHGDNAKEFGYMVEAGMPAIEAIKSATITNALLLKMENQLGQIKEGFTADIIAVDTDPIKNISAMENVTFVMKQGVVYKNE